MTRDWDSHANEATTGEIERTTTTQSLAGQMCYFAAVGHVDNRIADGPTLWPLFRLVYAKA